MSDQPANNLGKVQQDNNQKNKAAPYSQLGAGSETDRALVYQSDDLVIEKHITQERVQGLITQVDHKLEKIKLEKERHKPVPYSKLYCLADRRDKTFMIIGWICACVTGLGLPGFVFLFRDIINSFNPANGPEATLDAIKRVCFIMVMLGIGIWIFSYLYYTMLLLFSDSIGYKIRVKYVESILKQEVSWLEANNPNELPAKVVKESASIQRALGEKTGTIILAFSLTLSGAVIAFTRGWSFSLVILATFPFLFLATYGLTKVMQDGLQEVNQAYGQSAGYADQALNAIKVVVAFGQEEKEGTMY